MKPRISARRRLFLLGAHGCVCHICGGAIQPAIEKWEIDHVIPWSISRDDSDENCRPAHAKCHRRKTQRDLSLSAKGERVRAKHFGAWPGSRTPLPGGRKDRWKRKIDGSVVPRDI